MADREKKTGKKGGTGSRDPRDRSPKQSGLRGERTGEERGQERGISGEYGSEERDLGKRRGETGEDMPA